MPLSANTLSYEFDEEEIGFGKPQVAQTAHAQPLSGGLKFSLAMVAVGLLSLIVQTAGGLLAGSWLGLALSLGLLAVGAALAFWLQHRGSVAGIKHDGIYFSGLMARGGAAWIAGIGMTALYVLIYWFPQVLGQPVDGAGPTGLIRVVDPLARVMTGYPAEKWFLYGVLYTGAILVFGVRMMMKYRHNRYQQIRTASVAFFQLIFAWFLPNLL
ncbi:MAG TPA: hypothetical protein EYQ31_10820, partial [Candidatus Handelsmanbacteria bacterium]|nr:hypothetical protein [Candidatus Handelsmanbacteria bacterium]